MAGSEYLGYYASPSRVTDPGRMAGLLDGLPNDLAELRQVVRGLVIHYRAESPLEHGVPAERMREIDSRYAKMMLARLKELKDGPLTAPRSPTERLVGCCRDFTVLFLAMARAQGIPVRARVGFAAYFVPGYYLDHEVAEVWDAEEQRWRLVDPQLADNHISPTASASTRSTCRGTLFCWPGQPGGSAAQVYENDPELRVPDTVLSDDPLGGPRREVAWLRRAHGSASQEDELDAGALHANLTLFQRSNFSACEDS
ncbi:hypothetical protein BZG36_05619 [Bifiguratus adelaidae]|uniref:Transglutaminase-like domain-containing protein n=1 Tax=Bifiguratus adelaidae TaxID=1938954 RepID=A0A261XT60_9FUNG|nr:hypothetical protein BZG36_05619 [Bifiguratus adelaidae]